MSNNLPAASPWPRPIPRLIRSLPPPPPSTAARRPFFGSSRHPALDKLAGGAERIRTDDLLLAKQALSQLSYSP